MSKLYLTADLHFGESRFDLMGRPFKTVVEHDSHVMKVFNSVVKSEDHTIIIGDVINQNSPSSVELVGALNGTKTLIRGNHDRTLSDADFKRYFDDIIKDGDGLYLKTENIPLCWATHYPSRSKPNAFNLVGHVHGIWKCQLNMLNVGVDVHHFKPIGLSDVDFYYKAIHEFYDEDAWAAYNTVNSSFVGKRGKKGNYYDTAYPKAVAD